jgi:hypothetical protein
MTDRALETREFSRLVRQIGQLIGRQLAQGNGLVKVTRKQRSAPDLPPHVKLVLWNEAVRILEQDSCPDTRREAAVSVLRAALPDSQKLERT